MARAAKATRATKPAAPRRKPVRRAAVAAKKPAKVVKPAASSKRVSLAATSVSKVSKDELRAQVEKLERANATLRAKSREASRSAKVDAARIAALEDQVMQLERKAASETVPGKHGPEPRKAVRHRQESRGVDAGDAVPPGVTGQEPAALGEEAEEEHLGVAK